MHLHEEHNHCNKKGSLTLIFNDTLIIVKPNEIAIINSQIPHSATTNEKSKDGYVLYLKKRLFKNLDFNFSSAFELIKNKISIKVL